MQLGEKASKKLGHGRPNQLGQLGGRKESGKGGWKDAITDTERKIAETKARLASLKAALSFCKESLESGDPFPGEKKPKKKAA